jgi:hypothetical protein
MEIMPLHQKLPEGFDGPTPKASKYIDLLFTRVVYDDVPSYPITDKVHDLERKYSHLCELTSEILSTLQLEGNAHLFTGFPDDWHAHVEAWQKRFDKVTERE